MFDRSKLESLRDVSVTRIGDTISYGFPQTEGTCEANPAGENSSFIFTVCAESVPLYHFKLGHVVLLIAVK